MAVSRSQTPPIPGRLADQVSVAGGSPSEHSGSGRSNPVLGMDHLSMKSTESHSGVFVRGLRVPPGFSPCKTHSREMAQTPGFYPTTSSQNTLSGDVCTPVENRDLVPSFSHHIESQAHSRVSECDGRPTFQVESGTVDRMVTTSTGVQTDLPRWFTPHVDLFATYLNHKLPLYVSPIPDPKAWDIDALNINWTGLTAYAYPPTARLHRVIQKIRQCNCLIILIAPGWPGMPWFWDLVQLSTEIPLQLPVSTTLLKQSHNYVFHSNPQHLNLHAWCLGVDNSKNKASL